MHKNLKIFLREIVLPILIFIYLIPGMIGRITYVPSGSMTPTIMEGDKIVVSKLHFGPKTPETLFQIPIYFEKKYFKNPRIPSFRLPGIRTLKVGDCVIFNYPGEVDHNVDMRQWYVKRTLGQPGDRFRMEAGKVYINGKLLTLPAHVELQHRYLVTLQGFRYKSKEEIYLQSKLGIPEMRRTDIAHTYMIHTTAKEVARIKQYKEVKAVKPYLETPQAGAEKRYFSYKKYNNEGWTFAACLGGNEDYLPEIVIPFQGMKIDITQENLYIYGHIILHHEGHKEVHIDEVKGTLTIDGQKIDTYTVRQDYYACLGDNRPDSADFRSWGFVPKNHIVGKPVLILFSNKNKYLLLDLLTFQMRRDRFFKWVR